MEELINDLKEFYFKENSGHGFDHTYRVYKLGLELSKNSKADKIVISLASLLHDVDDYKLVGIEEAKTQKNAKFFLNKYKIDGKTALKVLQIINTMGYSNCLEGIRCTSEEGKYVSDADMLDAIGSHGILRTYAYNASHNRPFFNKDSFPQTSLSKDKYQNKEGTSSVNHFFEKLLLIKAYMLTEQGKDEADKRFKIMVDFLNEYFREENQPDWIEYLDKFIKSNRL